MVEHGTVIFFNNREGFGRMRITDEQGNPTEGTVHFGARDGAYPELSTEWLRLTLGEQRERNFQQLRRPRKGDRIVFLRDHSSSRPKAADWTFLQLWLDDEQQLSTIKFQWKLVAVADSYYIHQEEPGSLNDVCTRSTDAGTIKQGYAQLARIKSWCTGADLDFWYDDTVQPCGNETIVYELRIRIGDKWHRVRTITPHESDAWDDYDPYEGADDQDDTADEGEE